MEQKIIKQLLAIVKENYEEIAVDFDLTRKKEIWPKMRELVADIPANSRLLDVGCGNGRLLEALNGKKIDYLGIDNSEALVKIARNNYPDKKFIGGDILNLKQTPGNNFDYIFCLAVLQHIPSKELRQQALEQLKAKLASEGQLIISVWNLWRNKRYRPLLFKNYWLKITGRNQLDFNDLLFPWKNNQGRELSERYYHAFTKKELKKLARLANLRIKSLIRDKYNYWYILKNKE